MKPFSLLFICLAAISWGTTGTTMMLLNQTGRMHPLVVAFWRMALAAPLLLAIAHHHRSLWQRRSPSELLTYLGLGVCMAVYQGCFFWAVSLSGVAIAALVAICSSPLFVVILAAYQLGETLTSRTLMALVLGLGGTMVLVANPEAIAAHNPAFLLGVGLALVAGFSYAVYAVMAKVSVATLDPLPVAAFSFTASALLLAPALMLHPDSLIWGQVPFLLYLGWVPTGLAYALYFVALRQTPATIAGIATLLEPLTATLLGVVVVGESLGWVGGIGVVLLLSAIALLTWT